MNNAIPPMTDPLGKYWQQPGDIRQAPMDETHVILTLSQIAGLAEYSSSYPSGTYSGKCWKRPERECVRLVWYGEERGDRIEILSRIIIPCE